ncbi:MAG: hypothetical protein JWM97_534 [Phycisphaerales bacterium]|nr:hypothetical protein [Phycisphaerales bacterium]
MPSTLRPETDKNVCPTTNECLHSTTRDRQECMPHQEAQRGLGGHEEEFRWITGSPVLSRKMALAPPPRGDIVSTSIALKCYGEAGVRREKSEE